MTPDTHIKAGDSPLAEAERLLGEALRLLDGTQAHVAAAYTATALDALIRHVDDTATQH